MNALRFLLVLALVVGAGSVAAVALVGGKSSTGTAAAAQAATLPPAAASTHALQARFAVLSGRHSNRCALRPQAVDSLAVRGRLQGSCCTPMVFAHYAKQVRGLAAYRKVSQVPRDPYDIPVAQVKRLLGYDRTLAPTDAEQAVYRRAMRLADEHGPCCCHCWRWSAFAGQAKYLIARRGYTARQIADVWDLEDGCGG